ncbi:MAG: SDR family NAD(P)-dependent oxidoreductase [Anaerolineae bacterium]|nr:SDR family NAD(P)-dependent oxidoreductase [Anaerolineae bacterium]
MVQPWSASLSGLTMSLAREYPAIEVSCLDVVLTTGDGGQFVLDEADVTAITAEGGGYGPLVALRQGVRYIRRLAPLSLPAIEERPYRRGGVYLILGGAGGIGLETAVYLAGQVQAKVVLVGRSALTSEKEAQLKRIEAAGGAYLYCQADGTDLAQMQAVVRQAKEKFGAINGVIHSALVLRDSAISTMDEATFRAVLAPKVTGSVVLTEVVKEEALDFMLFFSSSQSLWGNAGQGNYAAASTFADAYALYLDQIRPYPVKIINWGYWGSIGVVATAAYRRRLAEHGIGSIEVEAGMAALDQIVAGPLAQVAAVKADRSTLAALGIAFERRVEVVQPEYESVFEGAIEQLTTYRPALAPNQTVLQQEQASFEALEGFAQTGLLQTFQQLGVFRTAGESHPRPALARQLNLAPQYHRFYDACLSLLEQGGYLNLTETTIETTHKVAQPDKPALARQQAMLIQRYPRLQSHLNLLQTCLQALPEIVTGRVQATEVMFPDGSPDLVAGIYQGTPVTDYFNQMVALAVKSTVEQRLPNLKAAEKIRIVEVGAGTGGTTSFVLAAIDPYRDHIDYFYTDISQGFTRYGQRRFGDSYSFIQFGRLDIEHPPAGQGFDPNQAEIVLGANVVHATKNIHHTLQNLKALLKANGLLILNEAIHFSAFATLTFGLLDGWWAFEDGEQRLEHTPLLTSQQWQWALQAAGFGPVHLTGQEAAATQAVILAESDGVVDIVRPVPEAVILPKAGAGHKPQAEQPDTPVGTPVDGELTITTAAYLKQLFAATLKIEPDRLKPDQTFELYGVDSIVSLEVVNRLRQDFGRALPATLLFEHVTLEKLADYFLSHHHDTLTALLTVAPAQQPSPLPTAPRRSIEVAPFFDSSARFQPKPEAVGYQQTAERSDIAIIGLSGRYPLAATLAEFWENLQASRNCIREIPLERWDYRRYYDPDQDHIGTSYSKWGGFIDDVDQVDPLFFNISPREAERMDPQERLFLETVWATVEDAGYSRSVLANIRQVGVFVGVMNAGYSQLGQEAAKPTPVAYWSLANRVSYLFDWRGPSLAVDTACSSSLTAIHLACESLKRGECQLAVAGGVNLIVHPSQYLGLSAMGMLSVDDKVKAFGAGADGFVDGEGVGAILLKPLSQAEADGDQIYGVIKGSAMNAGGKTSGYTVPNPNAQRELITTALTASGVEAGTISYVEAHGTGTALGDPIEIRGLSQAWSEGLPDGYACAIGSVKSNIGHLESAAGIAGLTKVLLQMKYQQLAPSLHAEQLNPHIDFEATPFQVQRELMDWQRPTIEINGRRTEYPRRAGISSFGAGGANAHLVVEEYVDQGAEGWGQGAEDEQPHLIILSARNEARLRAYVQKLLAFLEQASPPYLAEQEFGGTERTPAIAAPPLSLASLAYTLQVGREAMASRLACVVTDVNVLREKLTAYLAGQAIIESCYQGQVKPDQDSLNLLNDDDDSQVMIRQWLAKGKLEKLAAGWVRGLAIDWRLLYRYEKPHRISLPTYPFARERYWLGGSGHVLSDSDDTVMPQGTHLQEETGIATNQPPQLKPFLGRERVSSQAAVRFEGNHPLARDTEAIEPNEADLSDARLKSRLLADLKGQVSTISKVKVEELDGHESLGAYGFDSIMLKQLAVNIEQAYGVELSPAVFFECHHLDGLSAFLLERHRLAIETYYQAQIGQTRISLTEKGAIPPQKISPKAVKTHPILTSPVESPAVAIVGISGLLPQSPDLATFWQHLAEGHDLITEIPPERWDWRAYYDPSGQEPHKAVSKWGGFIPDMAQFDPLFFKISPREAEMMDPQHRLFLQVVWHCLEDAGYRASDLAGRAVGVYVGVQFQEYQELIVRSLEQSPAQMATGNAQAMLANRVSYLLDLRGPSEAIDTACSSSLVALHRAVQSIRSGEIESAIVGGVSLALSPVTYVATSQMGVLSPDGRCKTFDKAANGYVKGEGVGAVLLKPLAQAEADGDQIYALIRGSAENHGGRATSLTAPNSQAQAQLLVKAYEDAGVDIETVSYIETHGTGTELGDPVEIEGLKGGFAQLSQRQGRPASRHYYCGLGSVKTNIGHLEAAAGIAGLMKVLLALKEQSLPASLHFKEQNPYIELKDSPFYLVTETQAWSALLDEAGQPLPRRAGGQFVWFWGSQCSRGLGGVCGGRGAGGRGRAAFDSVVGQE